MPEQTEMLQRLATLEERVSALSSEVAGIKERKEDAHHEIYLRLNALEQSASVNGQRYDEILRRLNSMEQSIKDLTQRPAKRWEEAVRSAVSAIVGAIIGGIATKLLGGG